MPFARDTRPEARALLLARLGGLAVPRAVAERRAFDAVHLDTGLKVDLFVRGRTGFDIEEFRRRRGMAVALEPPLVVPDRSVEDSILRKLQWYREGGEVAGQQWRDVIAMLALDTTEVDAGSLGRWSAELGVGDLLVRARLEAAG